MLACKMQKNIACSTGYLQEIVLLGDFLLFSCLGTTHNRKDTRQDKGLLHAATNRTSQQSTVTADATEQCNGDDIMDCLVSFYGDVP